VTFTVEGSPVSVNHYKKPNGRGGYYVTYEALAWKGSIVRAARLAGVEEQAGEVSLSVRYYHEHPNRRLDVDNVLKVLQDSLNGVAWKDDKQVKRVEVEAFHDRTHPRVEVTLQALKGD
jgi:Holliday junction resolvase RusA-like endonuclease